MRREERCGRVRRAVHDMGWDDWRRVAKERVLVDDDWNVDAGVASALRALLRMGCL